MRNTSPIFEELCESLAKEWLHAGDAPPPPPNPEATATTTRARTIAVLCPRHHVWHDKAGWCRLCVEDKRHNAQSAAAAAATKGGPRP